MSVPYAAFPKYGPSVLGQAAYDRELAAWQAYIDATKHRRPRGEEEKYEGEAENLDRYTYTQKYVLEGQSRKRIFREQNIRAASPEDAMKQGRDAMQAELGPRFDDSGSRYRADASTEKVAKPRGKAFEEGEDDRRNEEGNNGHGGPSGGDDGTEGEGEGDDDGGDEGESGGGEGDGESDGKGGDDDTPKMPTCPECGEPKGSTEGCCKQDPPKDLPKPRENMRDPNLQLLRTDGEAPYTGEDADEAIRSASHNEVVTVLSKSLADVDDWTRKVVAQESQEIRTELYEALTKSHVALKGRIGKGGGNGKGAPSKAEIAKVRKEVKALVKGMGEQKPAEINVNEIADLVADKLNAPRRIEVSMNGEVHKIEGCPHKAFDEARECLDMQMPLFLVGPAGSGKGILAQHLADSYKLRFGFQSCSEGMSEGMVLGRGVPLADRFLYLQSSFVDCYENGGLFLLDEVDAANPNVLLIINECLSSPHLSIPNRVDNPYAVRHEDFHFVCAANTWGTGPNMEYVGRNRLDAAFLNRFVGSTIELDYDARIEGEIAKAWLGKEAAGPVLKRFWGIRKNLEEMNIKRVWSTRGLDKMCTALARGHSIEKVLKAHTKGWTQDEMNKAGVAA
jgi:MoxR-like ATPase